jgi:hypothetical protein
MQIQIEKQTILKYITPSLQDHEELCHNLKTRGQLKHEMGCHMANIKSTWCTECILSTDWPIYGTAKTSFPVCKHSHSII